MLVEEARLVLQDAKGCFATAIRRPELHRFIEDSVGPITVATHGCLSLCQTQVDKFFWQGLKGHGHLRDLAHLLEAAGDTN